jgi:hypothetical protein
MPKNTPLSTGEVKQDPTSMSSKNRWRNRDYQSKRVKHLASLQKDANKNSQLRHFSSKRVQWEWMKAHGFEEITLEVTKYFGKPSSVEIYKKV